MTNDNTHTTFRYIALLVMPREARAWWLKSTLAIVAFFYVLNHSHVYDAATDTFGYRWTPFTVAVLLFAVLYPLISYRKAFRRYRARLAAQQPVVYDDVIEDAPYVAPVAAPAPLQAPIERPRLEVPVVVAAGRVRAAEDHDSFVVNDRRRFAKYVD